MLKFDVTQILLTILQWIGAAVVAAGGVGTIGNMISDRPSADATPWLLVFAGGTGIATSATIALLLIHILRATEAIQRQTKRES